MTSRIVSEISYPSSAAIGGNYSNDDRTLTGENFTVGGDTTITNCDVLLATGTPQDSINLTWDNDATITGTQGSLIFGSMMQAPVMDVATVSSGATFPSGHIIQIQQTVKTTASNQYNSNASINWVDIPDMTCDIIPQTGNKVYVTVSANFGSPAGFQCNVRLMRGSTPICVGTDSHGSQASSSFYWRVENNTHLSNMSLNFLDTSPGGDGSTAITYKLQWTGEQGSTMYINQTNADTNDYRFSHQASTITLMEVVG